MFIEDSIKCFFLNEWETGMTSHKGFRLEVNEHQFVTHAQYGRTETCEDWPIVVCETNDAISSARNWHQKRCSQNLLKNNYF